MVEKSRIGLELPTDLLTGGEVIALGRLAEREGIDSLWLQETTTRDVVSLAGALSQVTSTLRIATGPINVWTRTPYLMAMTASALGELTDGQFILGLSPGHARTIETHHGLALIPLDDAPVRVQEFLSIVSGLLAGKTVTLDGRYLHVSEARLPGAGATAVPIYINARQGGVLEAVGEMIDGAILSIATPQWVREFAVPRIAAGAARAGRQATSVDVAYHPVLCLHEDEQRAIDAARDVVAPYFRNAEVIELLRAYGFADEIERIEASMKSGKAADPSDELVRAIALTGSPQAVAERIATYEAAGVTNMILRPYPVGGESAREATEQAIDRLLSG